MKYFAIFNSNAGSFSPWEVKQIERILSSCRGLEGKLIITNSKKHLINVLKHYKNYNPDILAIGGGDGTASLTLTAVKEVWGKIPKYILPFPCGTVSNYTMAFKLSKGIVDKIKKRLHMKSTKSIHSAQYLVDTINVKKDFNIGKLDLLDINGTKGFNFGIGMAPKILWIYYGKPKQNYYQLQQRIARGDTKILTKKLRKENKVGFSRALLGAFQIIVLGFIPFTRVYKFFNEKINAKISSGRNVQEKKVTAVFAASHEFVGFGINSIAIKPAYKAREHPGNFHAIVHGGTVNTLIKQLPKLFRGKKLDGTDEYVTSTLTFHTDKPVLYQVDGELLIDNNFTIKYDETLRIINPLT